MLLSLVAKRVGERESKENRWRDFNNFATPRAVFSVVAWTWILKPKIEKITGIREAVYEYEGHIVGPAFMLIHGSSTGKEKETKHTHIS